MSNRRSAGMTLVELIMAIVIISIGVAGLMSAYTAAVKTSVDPMISRQMGAIAEGLMEEIMLKPYAAAVNDAPAANARDTFNDVRDYAGYSSTGIYDIGGDKLPGLEAYSLAVTVANAAITGVAEAQKITVTVSHSAGSHVLTGWRTCYAGPPC